MGPQIAATDHQHSITRKDFLSNYIMKYPQHGICYLDTSDGPPWLPFLSWNHNNASAFHRANHPSSLNNHLLNCHCFHL